MTEMLSPPVYTDFSQFNEMRSLARDSQDKALPAVAKQFESIFMSMLMRSMRNVNEVFSKDNFLHSSAEKQYQDMYDQQLATDLSAHHGLGLADMMVRQLSSQPAQAPTMIAPTSTPIPMTKATTTPQAETEKLDKKEEIEKTKSSDFKTPVDFVKALWPYAKQAAKELGVNPKVLIAQAALETGWGKKIIKSENGESSHNLFNIKAGSTWDKEKIAVKTLEYEGNSPKKITDQFRQYDNFGESFHDYISLIKEDGRYHEAVANSADSSKYLQKLQEAGYATDPHYAGKIDQIASSDLLDDALNGMGV